MLLNLPDFISLIGTIFSVSLAFSPIVPFTQVIRKKEKIDIIPEGMLISTTICRLLYLCIWTVKKKINSNNKCRIRSFYFWFFFSYIPLFILSKILF